MISVIVPAFRVEACLERCVASILAQSFSDIEIILVDDGSPDRCGEICDRFAALDSRVKVIHQENLGLSGARNAGLECSSGEYVCFVDGDDGIDPRMLESMYAGMRSGQCDLVICGYRRFREGETVPPLRTDAATAVPLTSGDLWREVFEKLNNAAWGKLYRRALIGDLRFPPDLIHGEDLVFNLRYIARCGNGIIMDAPFYHYMVRPGSITRSGFRQSRADEITAKDMALDIVGRYRPDMLPVARVYCFRARMNVIRAICTAGLEREYSRQIRAYGSYTADNYPAVAGRLRFREKAEYRLFRSFRPLYRLMTGMRGIRQHSRR